MLPLATLRPAGVAAGVMAVGAAWLLRRKYSRPALRLTYLDIKSKAEPIRLALAIGGIPFEDRRVSYDQVASMRAAGELPFGQVPTLEIDGGRAHGQSLAILRWVGARAGLYPTSPSLQLDVDGAVQCLQDIQAALNPVFYRNALPRSPHTGKLYEATALSKTQCENVVDMLNRDLLPGRFAQLEAQLTRGGGPFLAGRELTIADLVCYVVVDGILDGSCCADISPAVLDACPQLKALAARVAELPEVRKWNARES